MKTTKKRLTSLLLSAICFGTMAAQLGMQASATTDPRDVNQDGTINIGDVIYLNRYLLGDFYVSDPSVLDANQNYLIDVADSNCIMAYVTESSYTCYYL